MTSTVMTIMREMMEQRGYADITEDVKTHTMTAIDEDGEVIIVFSSVIEKLNVAEIHTKVAFIQENKCNHGILVYKGEPTSAVKGVISSTTKIGITVELWCEDDLKYNITKSTLVPKHTKLSKAQTEEFKKKYGIAIPEILRTDPISRFYNYKKGDIIEIMRRSGVVGYRIVK